MNKQRKPKMKIKDIPLVKKYNTTTKNKYDKLDMLQNGKQTKYTSDDGTKFKKIPQSNVDLQETLNRQGFNRLESALKKKNTSSQPYEQVGKRMEIAANFNEVENIAENLVQTKVISRDGSRTLEYSCHDDSYIQKLAGEHESETFKNE